MKKNLQMKSVQELLTCHKSGFLKTFISGFERRAQGRVRNLFDTSPNHRGDVFAVGLGDAGPCLHAGDPRVPLIELLRLCE